MLTPLNCAQLLLEAYHAGDHSPGERFDTHAPCGAESGAGMSVSWSSGPCRLTP